jgi:hypothetical protein
MRDRLRQRALISLLRTHDGPPTILASQLFFLFDEKPHLDIITDNMTIEQVVMEVGNNLRSKQRLHEDVTAWARNLFDQAGVPFAPSSIDPEKTAEPPSPLSVVLSQPAPSKSPITPTPPKRKSRRIYLELAISLLERGIKHRTLVDAIMEQFPTLNRETVSTFVSDVQNPRYSPIKDRKVVKLPPDGRLVFEDKIKPTLTVIENPNFAGTGKTEPEPVTEAGKQAIFSKGDV